MLQVVIPLAGKAARFQERGHTFPKPLFEIGNRSMIEVVLENLAPPGPVEYTFICRKRDLIEASERMILKGLTTSGQFFVCPVYNELILSGKNIRTHHLPDGTMHSLGTPEDLDVFMKYRLGSLERGA